MNFVLTLDYELFGDGSGDVFRHMIEPTNRVLQICDKYGIKTTLFLEVVEYLKLKQEWDRGNTMGYQNNPVEAIEKQLQSAAVNGHDIQLHIHPQWVDARYENEEWKVDLSNWRLGSFRETGRYTIERLLEEGKRTIENIVNPVLPDYECIALRAGGYNIMPSDTVYKAMKKTGLKLDSSVFPGGYEDGELSNYDYRFVSDKLDCWWATPEDITKGSDNHREILEVPIFAMNDRRWRKVFNYHRLKSMFLSTKPATSSLSKSKTGKMSYGEKIKFLWEKESFTWDFFLYGSGLHHRFFNYIDNKLSKERNYVVLIAHPKSPFNEKAFKSLIKKINKRKGSFKTIARCYTEMNPLNNY